MMPDAVRRGVRSRNKGVLNGYRLFAVLFSLLMITSMAAVAVSATPPASYGEVADTGDPDAVIIDFSPEPGAYAVGDTVWAEVVVENTGPVEHTFFVGYGVFDPNGVEYDNDRSTGDTVTLAPGERETVLVSWVVEEDAPVGEYDALTIVWEESDPAGLYTRLDQAWEYDAFEVVESTDPEATIIDFSPEPGTYTVGDTVSAEVVVENTGPVEHTFFVGYGVFDPNGVEYDNDRSTGDTVTLAPGERETVLVSWVVEEDAPVGEYDALTIVWEESDPAGLYTRLDQAWAYDAFEVVESTDPEAEIIDFRPESGVYAVGDTVSAEVVVKNTGPVEHTFFVGYGVFDPNGMEYDNDRSTGDTVTLAPGERETVLVSWVVEEDAPVGEYDALTIVWEESDPAGLYTRLDQAWEYDAFQVVESTDPEAEIIDFRPESGVYAVGDTVSAEVVVKNTGWVEHTYFVGFGVFDPNGVEYDNDRSTGQAVTLAPGETKTVVVSWVVEEDAPVGEYDALTIVWEESDPAGLYTRLDQAWAYDAFNVVRQGPPDSVSGPPDNVSGPPEFVSGPPAFVTMQMQSSARGPAPTVR